MSVRLVFQFLFEHLSLDVWLLWLLLFGGLGLGLGLGFDLEGAVEPQLFCLRSLDESVLKTLPVFYSQLLGAVKADMSGHKERVIDLYNLLYPLLTPF